MRTSQTKTVFRFNKISKSVEMGYWLIDVKNLNYLVLTFSDKGDRQYKGLIHSNETYLEESPQKRLDVA